MVSKVIFIIPYYGKLPEYFKMWLLSVRYNPTVDFLLVTDIEIEQELPSNVKLLKWTWRELIENIQKPFDFKVNVKTPYHLCDFKPAYGVVFSEYIRGYDFWGNCDMDQIFGDIRKFMTEDILQQNDVIGYLGHFTLYRNKKEINESFKKEGSLFNYKEVFSTDEWYAFDEVTGIKQIVLKNKISHYYNQEDMADLMTAHKQIKLVRQENYHYQVFYWEEGKLFQAYIENKKPEQREFMYLHFQKKNPIPRFEKENVEAFYIFHDSFCEKKAGVPKIEEIIKYSHWKGKTYEVYEQMKWRFGKLKKYLFFTKAQRKIWLLQRRYVKLSDYMKD